MVRFADRGRHDPASCPVRGTYPLAHHGASQPVALSGDMYGFPVVFMWQFSDVTLGYVMKTKKGATTTTTVRTLTITT